MKTMKVADVVLDHNLYPRTNIDDHNVRSIMTALEAGAEIPPIIIDKKSRRVADGFHRVTAVIRLRGEDAEISVIERAYKSEAELFLDSMRMNAGHGVRLGAVDRVRCTVIAERLSIPTEAVAGALHMPIDKLGKLSAQRTARAGKLSVPIKRTIQHKAGHELTEKQMEVNERLSGMNQVFYVNQLIDLIESDLLDISDEGLMNRLAYLSGLIEQLPVFEKAA